MCQSASVIVLKTCEGDYDEGEVVFATYVGTLGELKQSATADSMKRRGDLRTLWPECVCTYVLEKSWDVIMFRLHLRSELWSSRLSLYTDKRTFVFTREYSRVVVIKTDIRTNHNVHIPFHFDNGPSSKLVG